MPKPHKGEDKKRYISRAIEYFIKKEGNLKDQAVAKAYSFWKQYKKK